MQSNKWTKSVLSVVTGTCLVAFAATALTYLGTTPAWAAQGPAFAAGSDAIAFDAPAQTAEMTKEAATQVAATDEVVEMDDFDSTGQRVVLRRASLGRPNLAAGESVLRRIAVRRPGRATFFRWIISTFG